MNKRVIAILGGSALLLLLSYSTAFSYGYNFVFPGAMRYLRGGYIFEDPRLPIIRVHFFILWI